MQCCCTNTPLAALYWTTTRTLNTHTRARTYANRHHHFILGVWTNDWSYSKSASHKSCTYKDLNFYWLQWISGHCNCVWAPWIRLYLKTVLLLSSVGESKLRTKFCTTWPPCSFWCKLLDRQNSTTSDCNSKCLRKLHSLFYTDTVDTFLYHCLICISFSSLFVFAINIIIIIIVLVIVRQPIPNNSDPPFMCSRTHLACLSHGRLISNECRLLIALLSRRVRRLYRPAHRCVHHAVHAVQQSLCEAQAWQVKLSLSMPWRCMACVGV
jgi:hypothetical protein